MRGKSLFLKNIPIYIYKNIVMGGGGPVSVAHGCAIRTSERGDNWIG